MMNIKEKIFGDLGKFAFAAKQKSPEILLIGGLTTMAAGTIMACRATLKSRNILDDHLARMEKVHKLAEYPEEKPEIPQLTTRQYALTALEYVRAFAPSLIVWGVGAFMVGKSHVIMTDRVDAALMLASGSTAILNEYRNRIRELFGEETEKMIFEGGHKETREIEEVDEKGKKHKKKEEVIVYDGNPADFINGMWFDEACEYFNKDSTTLNADFLMQLQDTMNIRRARYNFVPIMDVIRYTGMHYEKDDPRLKYWNNFGWVQPDSNEPMNRIDFGLNDERLRDFMSGRFKQKEIGGVWLSFKNVVPLFGVEWSGK